jgi:hypothetical protein
MIKLGKDTGSLINYLMAIPRQIHPEIGMGATILMWSDRHACTIRWISESGKTIDVSRDIAHRVDDRGMSDNQDYTYETTDDTGRIQFRLQKDGTWRNKQGECLSIGYRREHYDYSF